MCVVGTAVCTDNTVELNVGICVTGFGVVALREAHPKAMIPSMRLVPISRGILLFFISSSRIVFGI
jgi:hypothetical protein